MKNMFLVSLTGLLLTSCTYSIIMNHTEGVASDMVDETVIPTNDMKVPVNSTVTVPVSPVVK